MIGNIKESATPENLSAPRVLFGHKEIADFLRVSTKTLQRHLKSDLKDVPANKLGNRIFILESELVHWLKTHPNKLLK